jgi:hypothetical protein
MENRAQKIGYAVVRPGIDWSRGMLVSAHLSYEDAVAAAGGEPRHSVMVIEKRATQATPRPGDTMRLSVGWVEGSGAGTGSQWHACPLY